MFVDLQSLMLSTIGPLALIEFPVGSPPPGSANNSFEMWWFQDPKEFYYRWPDHVFYPPQRPTAVLYYNQELLFRGPPDRKYHVKIQAYKEEVAFNDVEGNINADYLFRYLAYGASLDIFSDYGEMDKWNEVFPAFKRYRALAYARTVSQYQNQRPSPEF